jgi:hypothetical protein
LKRTNRGKLPPVSRLKGLYKNPKSFKKA